DVGLLTILRFWGEVLVSVEYGQLWRRLGPRLTTGGRHRPVFYHPHYLHDANAHPLTGEPATRAAHPDQPRARPRDLLDTSEARACFARTEEAVLALKAAFYDQFTPRLGGPSA